MYLLFTFNKTISYSMLNTKLKVRKELNNYGK